MAIEESHRIIERLIDPVDELFQSVLAVLLDNLSHSSEASDQDLDSLHSDLYLFFDLCS